MLRELRTSIGYHTLSLFINLCWEEAFSLFKAFQHYSERTGKIKIIKDPPDLKNAYLIVFTGKDRGIRWIMRFQNVQKSFRYYGIETIINPKILSGEDDYIRAANATHLPKSIAAFNDISKEISDELPLFAKYLIKRIDYCINFDIRELKYSCDVELLIELIRRGNIPFNFKEPYDEIKHRRKSKENSFVLNSGSVNINCYSKHAEWLAEHPDRPGIEDSRYVIRFEAQSERNKIRYELKKATKFMSKEELRKFIPIKYLLSDEMSVKMVWDYFSSVIMMGDYYSLDAAIALVEERGCRHPRQERLINTLKLIANRQGIDNARQHISKIEDEDTREKELHKFDVSLHDLAGMGINPVTIPGRKAIEHLPGLLRIYTDMMKKQMQR